MNKPDFFNSNRGSFTIEASIIFSTIILVCISLIYIAALLYQEAYLQSCATKAAQKAAAIYSDSSKDMYLGAKYISDMKEKDLYGSLFDTDRKEKEQKIKGYLMNQIDAFSILKAGEPTVTVKTENRILYKKVNVSLNQHYKIPLGEMLKTFGFSSTFVLKAEAEAVVNNPVEFIRNTDFLIDTTNEVLSKNSENKSFEGNISSKFSDIFNRIKKLFK